MGIEADTSDENDSFVYVDVAAPLKSDELNWARRFVIGDAYARFCHARGDNVLFAPAIGTFGEEVEEEAAHRGVSPQEVADSFVDRLRERCDRLAISCDWTKSVVTSRPELRHRTQRIFLELFEKGLIYQRDLPGEGASDRPWHLRCDAFSEWCSRGLEGLSGWEEGAIEAQRKALGRVEGVEIDAALLGGGRVPVFTPYPDAIGDSAFIAMSPHHPNVQAVASPSDLEQLRNDSGAVAMAQTAMQAAVPGVDDLLSVVLTPAVDERFGPTLCLGIPDRDDTDREIAARLVKSQGLPFRTTGTRSEPRPATRFRLPDLAVSRIGEWGAAVPLVHCGDCGAVSADIDEGPVGSAAASECQAEEDEADACVCPKCGGSARRDRQVVGGQFDRMWAWMAIPVPPEDRGSSSLAHRPELDRWLPVRQAIWGAADAEQFLAERIAARAVSELSPQQGGDPAEPFAGALACGPIAAGKHEGVGSDEELDELTAEIGSDAVRLAILHSASAGKATSWVPASFRHSQRFLGELRDYAEPRLSDSDEPQPLEIDRSTRLRRRLSAWCKAAETKVSTNLEQMRVHRATYNLMLFLKRIRDFEKRCIDSGELSQLDRDAVAVALLRLVRLAAPCVPNIAAELEAIAKVRSTAAIPSDPRASIISS